MKVLLVSPSFHGYHHAISDALAARGHHVSTHVYDSHPSLGARAFHQLRHELPRRVGLGDHRGLAERQTADAVDAVRATSPDAVVIVKGDTLGQPFWDAIDGLPRVTWLYDEVRRTRYTPDGLARVGPVATYSRQDAADFVAAGLDARHLPLAYDQRLVPAPTGTRAAHVSFVGARYPTREDVLTQLVEQGVPVRAYGRDWSTHPVDRLRTWRYRSPNVPSDRDVSRAEAYEVMAASAATLNLHDDQDGFTMRTFEAAGVGGVQLIDREDVGDLYDPGTEVLLWTDLGELTQLCRRALADRPWAEGIRSAARTRTLSQHTFDHRVVVLERSWDTN